MGQDHRIKISHHFMSINDTEFFIIEFIFVSYDIGINSFLFILPLFSTFSIREGQSKFIWLEFQGVVTWHSTFLKITYLKNFGFNAPENNFKCRILIFNPSQNYHFLYTSALWVFLHISIAIRNSNRNTNLEIPFHL